MSTPRASAVRSSARLRFGLGLGLGLLVACGDKGEGETTDSGAEVEVVVPGDVEVAPTALDFGTLRLGEQATQTFTITNLGQGALQLFDIGFEDDSKRPSWSLSGGLSGELTPGTAALVTVVAHPISLDDPTVRLQIQSDDPESPELTLRLNATAVGEPSIRLDPESTLDVGTVTIGSQGEAELRIANDGTDDLHIDAVTLIDDTPGDWSIVVNAEGTVIPARSEGGLVLMRLSPTAGGPSTAVLTIESDDARTPSRTLTLTGQAVP